jgi:putative acetyltransferase
MTTRSALGAGRDTVIEITYAYSAEQIEQVRALFLEYQASLDVDLCFQGFTEELAGLPGSYAPPSGRLLLATVNQHPGGCAALQAITPETCEMKRVYVQPEQRGIGLGRLLVGRVLDEARAIGYRRICLDTLPSMTQAAAMYLALGFEEIPPYRHNPVSGTRYMALSL